MNKKLLLLPFYFLLFTCVSFAQSYSIERYLNIRSASSPNLSPDGNKLAFLTNITGTSQVWFVDSRGGYPEQITAYSDNISFVRWLPNGKGLIFGKAIGGNENTQFYWLSADGSEVKSLTDSPKIRYNFGEISDDSSKIYYVSNKRDANFFDVYSMNLADGKEELLLQQDGNNDFVDVSPDGSKIIVSRSGTEKSLDNDLYLVDVSSKKSTLLTEHKDASQFGDVHFIDNDTIIFANNEGREFINLGKMNVNTKDVRMFNNMNWDVDATTISDDKTMFAYTLNREGFSELFVGETKTIQLKATPIKLPTNGVIGGLQFSKDKSQLYFTFNSAKNPTDIWNYNLLSKQLTQITKSSKSGIPQSSFVEPELIRYKSFDGKEITAWYYIPAYLKGLRIKDNNFVSYVFSKSSDSNLPENSTTRFSDAIISHTPHSISLSGNAFIGRRNDRGNLSNNLQILDRPDELQPKLEKSSKLPVIVSVHGGPEGQERPTFSPLYQYYLSRGYAVLATNVRGSTGYGKTFTHADDVRKREDSVKDLASAVDWLKTSGGADDKKIAVMGGSYGGYMTLAAITLYPDLWAAAVDTVGIANWESFLKNTSGYRRKQREVEYGSLEKDGDFLRSISPLAKADKIKCPLFVIQGKNDPRVPYTEAEQIVKAVKDKGGIVQYKLYDDEGHGIAKLKNRLDLYPQVADFLDKYMK
jgi:dipeptidyl aminopeptidase/acylaminoacyl peptidase